MLAMCALKIIEEWSDLNTNILLEISRVQMYKWSTFWLLYVSLKARLILGPQIKLGGEALIITLGWWLGEGGIFLAFG